MELLCFSEILTLIFPVVTRWNSLWAAMDRFLKMKEALNIFWTKYCEKFKFTAEEWVFLEEVVDVLYPLYYATTQLSAEKHTSISKTLPLVNRLKEIYNGKL